MEILFFAAIAVFIFFKLREQLGKVDEETKRDSIKKFIKEQSRISNPEENPSKTSNQNSQQAKLEEIIILSKVKTNVLEDEKNDKIDINSQKILNDLEPNLRNDLELVLKNTKISPAFFLQGAKSAFEIINSAFASGDISTLKNLLSEKMFPQFQSIIEARKTNGEIVHSKIISIDEAKINSAKMENNFANISINFKSKQINFSENNLGEVIFGSKNEINTVIDNWYFKKDCNNTQNPNWLLSATK